MTEIPLQPIPSQEIQVILDGQNCTISVYWRFWKLYMDLMVDSEPVFTGAMCQLYQWVNQSPSILFSGGLMFVDALGEEAPCWDGLGSRWSLLYLDADEMENPQAAAMAMLEEEA